MCATLQAGVSLWWITNQILKAGVKKSRTYDEQNEKFLKVLYL